MLRSVHIAEIAAESAGLALVFVGIAATTLAFQHARGGMPLAAVHEPAVARVVIPARTATPAVLTGNVAGIAIPALGLPRHVFLNVPFTPQAPSGDWSDPYDEACEEASVAMAMAWVRGETLSPGRADDEIIRQVAFEDFHFGYNHDTALRETAKLFTRFYGYRNVTLAYGITPVDIKRELAGGNVVLVPAAGDLLANPYYRAPPPYHMVVVVGYDEAAREFIAHDPGTRYGANFRYPYPVLWNAIHDWTGSDDSILNGEKGMIVVRPEAG